MARGSDRWWSDAPWWAWVVSVVGALVLIVGVPLASGRGQLTQAEAERINADLAAEAAAEAAASAAAAEAAKLQVVLPADRPLNVLFSGDSITFGHYATDDARKWASLVAAGLGPSDQVSVTNTAVPGYMVTDGLGSQTPADVDLAFVMYGNNDVERSNLDKFRADYAMLLGNIEARSPTVQVVCVSPWLSPTYRSDSGNLASDFSEAARSVCDEAGARFIDVTHLFDRDRLNAQIGDPIGGGRTALDAGHPSDEGHATIARAVLSEISAHAAS